MDFLQPQNNGPLPGIGAPLPPDPIQIAKDKLSKGQPLTADETRLIGSVPMDAVSKSRTPPPDTSKPDPGASNTLTRVPTQKLNPLMPPSAGAPDNNVIASGIKGIPLLKGQPPLPPPDVANAPPDIALPSPDQTQPPPSTMPIAKAPPVASVTIPSVTKTAPPPIITGALTQGAGLQGGPQAAQATQAAFDKPITPDQAGQATDAISKFLASNPSGFTLGNILDVVGVALSARGGVQRQTQLEKTNDMRRQLAMQQTIQQGQFNQEKGMQQNQFGQQGKLQQGEFAQQSAMQSQELANQTALLQQQLKNAIATNNNASANTIRAQLAQIAAQTAAEQKMRGLSDNNQGRINKYSGAPQ
jgi:hypothetical protein